MSSSAEIFQQVRAAVDIVEVIGEHVALKRAGKEFKGLCCFHDDHKPSMSVVPEKQIFHCFVCGTGGDVFKFVKEYHKLSNGEALRMLAQRAGIKLPELPPRGGYGGGANGGGQNDGPSIREQIALTNEWACGFFEKNLRSPEGKLGLDYLHSRGLTDETITKFRLGFAPNSWTALCTAALRLGLKPEHLDQAGLIKKRNDSSPYDVFRNRVIFPIIDATSSGGRVIAFGGRVLEEKRDEAGNVVEAKYLNSPETQLFNKSASMYGINHARQHIIRTRVAVVVEGYMDVIAAHQVGVTNVIATLGTALTPEHARALKNYAQTIVLLFDSDDAGYRAADRAMEVFVRGTLDIKLASVPDGKDPCDFCMKNTGEQFQKVIDTGVDAMTYQWNRLAKQFHATQSLSAKQEAITQFLRFAGTAMETSTGQDLDPVRRGLLLSKISNLVAMPIDQVNATLKKLARQNAPRPTPQAQGSQSLGSSPTPDNWPSIPQEDSEKKPETKIDLHNLKGIDAAEAWLLGALLAKPTLYDKVRDEIALNLFVRLHPLAVALIEYFDNHHDLAACNLAELTTHLEDPNLVRHSIELEKRVSDWLDPSQLSPANIKMLQQCADDRGQSIETLVADSLDQLRTARGESDPNVTADLGLDPSETPSIPAPPSDDPAADALRDFMGTIQKRNLKGGNIRNTGYNH